MYRPILVTEMIYHRMMVLLLMAIVAVSPVNAQQQTTDISGRVLDPDGEPVAGAIVEVRKEGGLKGSVRSNALGMYQIRSVPPGQYDLEAKMTGFGAVARRGVRVSLNDSPSIDFKFTMVTTSEIIVVEDGAPVIDPRSASVSETISTEQFSTLPRGQDYTSLIHLVPGVVDDPRARGISIYGATGGENRYVLDGVDVTDPQHGTSGKILIPDFVEEVNVKLAGYEAEYGGATGGIINVVTRTGTNILQGSLGARIARSGWDGAQRPILQSNTTGDAYATYVPQKDKVTTLEPGVSLSGPISRDRIWFFAAVQPQLVDTERTVNFLTGVTDSYDQSFRRDNVSANVSGGLLGVVFYKLSANSSGHETENTLPDQSGLFESDRGQYNGISDRLRNESYSFYADALLRREVVTTIRGGKYLSRYRLSGNPNEDLIFFYGTPGVFPEVPPALVRPDGYRNIPSNHGVDRDDVEREDLALDVEVASQWYGSHKVKAGLQWDSVRHDVRKGFLKPLWFFMWNQNDFIFGESGEYGALTIEEWFSEGKAESRSTAIFLQDRWTSPGQRLTVSAGVRAEEEAIPSYADSSLGQSDTAIRFDYDEKIAPRLGLVFDPRGDGKWRVSASYGTFHDRFRLSLPLRLFGGYRNVYYTFKLDTYDWPSIACSGIMGLPTDQPHCSGATFVGLLDAAPLAAEDQIDPYLRPTESREWTLGVQHEVVPGALLRASYIHRELVDVVETVGVTTRTDGGNLSRRLFIANPGKGLGRQPAAGLPPFPRAVRDYDALELQFRSGTNRKWWLETWYMYSRLWGNYTGVLGTDDIAQRGPNQSQWGDNIFSMYDAQGSVVMGPLPSDRRHQLKATIVATLPWDISLGIHQYLGSGTPISREMIYQGVPFFPEGRGAMGRTPTLSRTDLLIQKSLEITSRVSVQFDINILNLLDEDTVVAVYPRYTSGSLQLTEEEFFRGFDPDQEAGRKNAAFGLPMVYQDPREVWISLKLIF